ncbi:MAG: 1-acyl-sn-glycerol-3-phosphate acyltransferase [Proteobacteria bacterium]|nr:1-acyl-sn-glycerol-3-phosphate acyltransferase [Pseudomonadota bacterium]
MNAIRSVLFNILFFLGCGFWSIALLWTLALPEEKCAAIVSFCYGGYITLIEKYVLGLTLEMKGLDNLPKEGGYIIAAKHQSAFETLKLPFTKSLGYPAIILKRELARIPVYGWYFRGMGQIPIDRGSGTEAMNSIVSGCQRTLSAGRSVIIFPQGTRVAVGVDKPYKVGIAKVYRDVKVPVVPMALNSGVFWGRNAFFKKSGVVTFEFLPAIPAGLPPLQMMEQLERDIETATNRLVAAAQSQRTT